MADFVTGDSLRRLKAMFGGAPVITYVNSTAEVKAESDICCTSSNAVEVVRSFPREATLLFVPDRNLAHYAAEQTGRPFVITSEVTDPAAVEPGSIVAWDGYCYVHDDLVLDELTAAREKYPNARVVIHPEARRDLLDRADYVSSTAAMVQIAQKHDELIIGTERGLIDRLQKQFPEKTLIPLSGAAICGNMKMNTLAKLAWSLDHMQYEIVLEEGIRTRAEAALRGMLELSGGWRAPTAREEEIEAAGFRAPGCGCA
jgi:quinolinate synthase